MSTERRVSDTSAIAGLGGNFASANEVFLHLTIPQIQKLNNEYKGYLRDAKSDLHDLVGEKYRDLIRIAEDIDNMHALTQEVDTDLSDLSYKKSKFVTFNSSNANAKLNSRLRTEQIQKARSSSKSTILNYLINKKLVALDLKLANSKHFKNAPWLIHYSKLYYTIETVFEDILATDVHLRSSFTHSKERFIAYLEKELAEYNAPCEDYIASDTNVYSPKHRITSEDIMPHSSSQYALLDTDDLDIFSGEYDFVADTSAEEEMSGLDNPSPRDTISKTSPQILNYLIPYIILNHSNPELNTLMKILEKFISLRLTFLESLLDKVISYPTSRLIGIRFFKLLYFVENTCEYVSRYFESGRLTSNDLLRNLKQVTSAWKATDLLGFHDWFEIEEIKFNQEIYLISLPHSSLRAMNESLSKLTDSVWKFLSSILSALTSSGHSLDNLSGVLVILHNFLLNLGKIEISSVSNGKASRLSKLVTESGFMPTLLKTSLSKTREIFTTHFNCLCENGGTENITTDISSRLSSIKQDSHNGSGLDLFSSQLVSLIDSNLNSYIYNIRDAAFTSSLMTEDSSFIQVICNKIENWFNTYGALMKSLETEKQLSLNKQDRFGSLAHLTKFLSRKFDELDTEYLVWGSFSYKEIVKEYSNLRAELSNEFWQKLDSFVTFLSTFKDSVSDEDNLEKLYFLLHILVTVKRNILTYENQDKRKTTITSIDTIFQSIYALIFKQCSELRANNMDTYLQSIQNAMVPSFNIQEVEADLPTRPSLKISALMYQWSAKILTPYGENLTSGYSHCNIFSDAQVKEYYSSLKQKWLTEQILNWTQSRVEQVVKSTLSSTEETTPEEQKSSAQEQPGDDDSEATTKGANRDTVKWQLVSTFANMIYILSFTTNDTIDLSHANVKEYLALINSNGEVLSESDSRTVVKHVTEYYQSNKGIYLPLSVS